MQTLTLDTRIGSKIVEGALAPSTIDGTIMEWVKMVTIEQYLGMATPKSGLEQMLLDHYIQTLFFDMYTDLTGYKDAI